jgi:hypothetical protein
LVRKGHSCNVDYYGQRSVSAFEAVANGGTTGAYGDLLTSLGAAREGIVYSIESYCNAFNCQTPIARHVERSYLISPAGEERLLAGKGVRIVAVAAGVVVARHSESLDVYALGTGTWRTITTGPMRAVRANHHELFVLRPHGLLEIYELESGRRINAQQLGASGIARVQLEDVDRPFVVYIQARRIYVRRMSDRRDVVLQLPPGIRAPIHAQIERAGLYYSYNLRSARTAGRVGFVARRRLARAF